MSGFNFPIPVAPSILGDSEYRTSRIGNLYPVITTGPYTTWKLPVIAATTSNITLSGLQTIDSIVLTAGDRVLVKNQTIGQNNGIYVVYSLTWQRANDLELGVSAAAMSVFVNEGTTNENLLFVCTNDLGSDIVGLNSLTFQSVSSGSSTLALQASYIYVGNPSNVATGVPMSGDATMQTSGALTLINTGVTAGTYSLPTMTVDSKGRVTFIENGSATATYPEVLYLDSSDNIVGSSNFTFLNTLQTVYGITTDTQLSLGDPSGSTYPACLIASNPTLGSGNNGLDLIIAAGTGDTAGNGGNLLLFGGNINGSGAYGNIQLLTVNTNISSTPIAITAQNGGLSTVKGSGTLATFGGINPQVNTRQGIITITDPSLLGANTFTLFTVLNTVVQATDMVLVNVQNYAYGTGGNPIVQVTNIVVGTSFQIVVSNIDTAAMQPTPLVIGFILI